MRIGGGEVQIRDWKGGEKGQGFDDEKKVLNGVQEKRGRSIATGGGRGKNRSTQEGEGKGGTISQGRTRRPCPGLKKLRKRKQRAWKKPTGGQEEKKTEGRENGKNLGEKTVIQSRGSTVGRGRGESKRSGRRSPISEGRILRREQRGDRVGGTLQGGVT